MEEVDMKKNSFTEFEGTDKKRAVKLNQVTLNVNSKGYAPLLFFGDLHYGYPGCELESAQAMLDWALKEKVQVILMGDLLECGLTSSIGDSVYQQTLNPEAQMYAVIDILKPLADANLIIGLHAGNHERRIKKVSSFDVSRVMAKLLRVPYLDYKCWHILRCGNQTYTMCSTHGHSGSTKEHTKIKVAIDFANNITSKADVVAMGHVHTKAVKTLIREYADLKSKCVRTWKTYVVVTGSYLGYFGSYGEEKGYPIPENGSPKAKFLATSHDVHFSL